MIRVQAGCDDQDGEQDTKTQAGERTIPLAGRLRAILAAHKLATGRDGEDLVFGRTRTAAFVRSTLRARALKAWRTPDYSRSRPTRRGTPLRATWQRPG